MQRENTFYYLSELLGGYFHQDAFVSHETIEDIIRDFKASSWEYQRLGVRADIQRLIHEYGDQLLESINEIFNPDVIIGQTDDEAREWLMRVDAVLRA